MLIAIVRRHWALRAVEAAKRRRASGFDWAAGELLRGTAVPDVLAKAEDARQFEDYFDEFDNGIIDACNAWEALHRGQ